MSAGGPAVTNDLDRRYTREVALRHELLYGRGYQGPGSLEVFEALVARLDLRPGLRVLDVGSGLGGDALRLAGRHQVQVLGLDAASDMTAVARERLSEEQLPGVQFVTGDARTTEVLAPASFDVVWTRDAGAFVPEPEKLLLWRRLFAAAIPGAQVLVTDYCRGDAQGSAAFAEAMVRFGQHMIDFGAYARLVTSAGFTDVRTEDRTVDLLESMYAGRRLLLQDRAGLERDLTPQVWQDLHDRWEKKIGFAERDELRWLVLTARRPGG